MAKIASPSTGGGPEECYKGKLVKVRPRSCEHYRLWLYNLLILFVINSRVKRIMITQPFDKALISFLLYYFFYPKYVLLRLLKFLFIKRTLNFLSVITSYFICHWNVQLNFRNCKNLFRPSLSVSFIKCFLFFVILTLSPIEKFGVKDLPPNCGYKFFHTLISFSYDVLPSESFLSMNELYYGTSKSSTSTNFLVLLAQKYLNIFSLIVLLNLSITQDFSSLYVD